MPQQNIHKSHKPETWQSYDAVLSSTFLLHKRVSDSHFERLPADGKSLTWESVLSFKRQTMNVCQGCKSRGTRQDMEKIEV